MSNDMPEQPKTQQLPAADKNEILLAELKVLVVSGFKDLDSKVDRVETNLGIVSDDVRVTKDRLANAESRLGTLESRASMTSDRVRSASQVDLDQASQLAQERAAREALADEVAETKALAKTAVEKLKEQSDLMGIGKKGIDWATSKDGRASLMRLATTLAAMYAAFRAAGVLK